MGNKDLLFQIADTQQGYFTSQQAEECGFVRTNFHRFLASKQWIKELRGIYRLAHYPLTQRPELVLWSLWSRDKQGKVQGIWSHATALDIYELSDAMPAKMHMTVPKRFRRSINIPKMLVLHFADLPEIEVQRQQGYLVTTPLRTIVDVTEESKLSEELIVQAIQDAIKQGLILHTELAQASKTSSKLERLLNDYKL
ncbi:MAG TPA: type IV toxin-antitoxin system AbiEi family antitoxin domain-containing protein [Rhabdochlamydiaceae bacterium]|nr:type IV toxin-antitoxin system AbiEi family antitoxin domain-containing protein [Rhabdochlamydiaceae bacterium]